MINFVLGVMVDDDNELQQGWSVPSPKPKTFLESILDLLFGWCYIPDDPIPTESKKENK